MARPTVAFALPPRPEVLASLSRERPDCRVVVFEGEPGPLAGHPLLVFVEWLLPDASGLEMCRRLRASDATAAAHITLVLEDGDTEARRRALRAGADDYVVGPLTVDHVLSRLRVHTPASAKGADGHRLGPDGLAVDIDAFQVRHAGRLVPLRPNEFRLLAHFLAHRDQLLSRAALIDALGKQAERIDERTVDVWVGRLRRALIAAGAVDPIRTVRNRGYVLDSPTA